MDTKHDTILAFQFDLVMELTHTLSPGMREAMRQVMVDGERAKHAAEKNGITSLPTLHRNLTNARVLVKQIRGLNGATADQRLTELQFDAFRPLAKLRTAPIEEGVRKVLVEGCAQAKAASQVGCSQYHVSRTVEKLRSKLRAIEAFNAFERVEPAAVVDA